MSRGAAPGFSEWTDGSRPVSGSPHGWPLSGPTRLLSRRRMSIELRDFLTLSYSELEELNLVAKKQRTDRVPMKKLQDERLKYLAGETRIKAVTVIDRKS